ncbi:hypothetical protein CsSME_00010027 [Camellia sinensis var. sinensis]
MNLFWGLREGRELHFTSLIKDFSPPSYLAAGTINLNGTLTVEVRRPGGETTMGDIVRLVEAAQSREAPVQRLADKPYLRGQFLGKPGYNPYSFSDTIVRLLLTTQEQSLF